MDVAGHADLGRSRKPTEHPLEKKQNVHELVDETSDVTDVSRHRCLEHIVDGTCEILALQKMQLSYRCSCVYSLLESLHKRGPTESTLSSIHHSGTQHEKSTPAVR